MDKDISKLSIATGQLPEADKEKDKKESKASKAKAKLAALARRKVVKK